MKLQLVAVGTKMPDWVQTGFSEYLRRFPKDMPFELVEIPAGKRGKNADIKRILEKEGEMMLAAAGKNRIVTWIFRVNHGIRRSWRANWNAGNRTGATSVCWSAARKASLQPVKQRRNRVGRSPPSPYLTRWCCAGGREPVSGVEHYHQPSVPP